MKMMRVVGPNLCKLWKRCTLLQNDGLCMAYHTDREEEAMSEELLPSVKSKDFRIREQWLK